MFDLAHVFAGGRVLCASDQHFGIGSNLILPGRGKNMGDGWETKRSRKKDHNDWAVIQLCVIFLCWRQYELTVHVVARLDF